MDKLSSIRAFVAVADLGSFSAAAESLRISKAMTTKHIQQLEQGLGIRLFSRSTRRLRLTEAGEHYLEGCRTLLQELAELERQVSGFSAHPHGRLKVLAPTSFGSFQLAPVLAEYAHRFPEVQVQLTLSDRPLGLLEEGVDVAILIGALEDSRLVARKIAEVQLVVCAAPGYLAVHGAPTQPADLLAHNCLRYSQGQRKGMWLLNTEEGEITVRVHGDFEATTGDAVRMAAIAGLGLVQLPSYMVRADLNAGRLQPVLAGFAPATMPLFAVYAHREPPATVRTFVSFLEECFHHPL